MSSGRRNDLPDPNTDKWFAIKVLAGFAILTIGVTALVIMYVLPYFAKEKPAANNDYPQETVVVDSSKSVTPNTDAKPAEPTPEPAKEPAKPAEPVKEPAKPVEPAPVVKKVQPAQPKPQPKPQPAKPKPTADPNKKANDEIPNF